MLLLKALLKEFREYGKIGVLIDGKYPRKTKQPLLKRIPSSIGSNSQSSRKLMPLKNKSP
jgi:hypothetical protein